MAEFDNPLTDKHCECLNECLQRCAITRQVLERMRKAGIPDEEKERINAQQEALARGIKREFFPDRP